MKRICFFNLLFLVLSLAAQGQETELISKKEQKRIAREEKKLAQSKALEKINDLVRHRSWVMEVHAAYTRSGQSRQLNSSLNFVSVIVGHGIIQLVFDDSRGGFQGFDNNGLNGQTSPGNNPISDRVLAPDNGVGGVTFQGNVWDYNVFEPKKANQGVSAIAILSTQGGTVQVNLVINSAERCEMTTSWGWGDRLTLKGLCLEPAKSKIYKAYDSY